MRFGIPVVALRFLPGALSLALSSAGFCQVDVAVQQSEIFSQFPFGSPPFRVHDRVPLQRQTVGSSCR